MSLEGFAAEGEGDGTAEAGPAVQGAGDVVAASLLARVSGEPVLVESLTEEFSTTVVNPDGSFTASVSTGQQRFRGADGKWVELDLTMAAMSDGSVGPRRHQLGVVLPGDAGRGAGAVDAVSVTHPGGGRAVTWRLPVKGKPVLEGTKARYVDAWPGVDVVVATRRSGFEQTFVVKDPGAVDGLPGGDKVSWTIPLRTKGLTARPGEGGLVEFVDAKGAVVSTVDAPVAFDAVVDERSGLPANSAPVDLQVRPVAGKGRAELVVSVDRAWLTDEARVFPVTVDPTYAAVNLAPSMDTSVQKAYPTSTSGATRSELWVGTYNGGTDVARAFLNFPTAGVVGKQVMTAHLSLYENWSWSCTARPVGVHATTTTVSSSVTWSTKPTYNSTAAGSLNVAKGFSSSCAAGRVEIPVTSLIQSWAAGTATTRTLMVRAESETDNYGWKKFHSSEGQYPPVLKVTYNRVPAKPATPVLSAGTSTSYVNPGDGAVQTWTAAKRPTFQSSTSDADANWSKIVFQVHSSSTVSAATLVATCTTGFAAGGTVLGCAAGSDLPDNTRLYLRAKAVDSVEGESGWSGFKTFYADRSAGAVPVITCPTPYSNGSWQDVPPTSNVNCRVSGAAASTWDQNVKLKVQVDGTAKEHSIPGSSDPDVAGVNVTVPKTNGGHTIRAVGVSRTGVETAAVVYSFGYGVAGMVAPVGDPRPTVTGVVPVSATAPPAQSGQTVTAKVRYRTGGSDGGAGASNWFEAPDTLQVKQEGGQSVATGNWNTAATAVDQNTGADERVPVVLEVQVCFTYGGGVSKCTGEQDARSVFRVPHAFGNGFPVAEAGPGQVALFTGEFNTTLTDVMVPGYTGEMALSRSHATYGLPATAAQGVFGPGWVAHLEGSEAGLARATLIDNTLLDGSLVLVDGDGGAVVFDPPSSATGTYLARAGASLETGQWWPGSQDTAASGLSLSVTGTGAATAVAITDLDGNTTTFTATSAPALKKAGVFAPASVEEVGIPGQTTFTRDAAGRVTRIVAPAPPGVSCPGTGSVPVGCRALEITYATTTGGTQVAGQVSSVSAILYDPATGQQTSTVVATYAYDPATKRLVSVTDPRTGLSTSYSYDAAGRLTGLTPPGVLGYTLTYTGGSGTDPAQLTAVHRGSTQLGRFLYGINPAEPPAGTPDLGADTVAKWGQEPAEAPTYAAAVFGADKPVSATSPVGVAEEDWKYASLYYTTARGYMVNEASYGAGQWQVTSTSYDTHGNVDGELGASAVAKTAAFGTTGLEEGEQAWSAGQVQSLATLTRYNDADIKHSDGTVLAPAGTLVTDTYGSARTSFVPGIGVVEGVRPHTHTDYDQHAPNGGKNPESGTGYNLPTTITVTAAGTDTEDLLIAGAPVVLAKTVNAYDPVSPGTGSGWRFASPTKVVTGYGSTTSSAVTVLDAEGRVIEQRQPSEAATGNGPGTRKTVYYTAGANTIDAACGNKPAWAGLVCTTGPAQTPDTGLPTERVTAYSKWLQSTVIVETSNGATRATTTGYDAAGRVKTVAVQTTGLTGSVPVPTSRTTYHPSTGAVTKTEALNQAGTVVSSIGYAHDTWGRQTGYTNSLGETTTTTYDAAGRVASVSDPHGSTTYTYDGSDATDKVERRGLVTKVVHTTGGRSFTLTGAYDANETLVLQVAPGGISQTWKIDAAGEPVEQFITGPVTDPDTGIQTSGTWLGWSLLNDPLGRIALESTPAGAVFDGSDTTNPDGTGGVGDGFGYERAYTYDPFSRLAQVTDLTATTSAGTLTSNPGDGETPTLGTCQSRSYTFDANSNRTSLTTTPCGQSTGAATTWLYNAGDAPITGANGQGTYAYDAFGRQTRIPKADTPMGSTDLTLGYDDNDAPRWVTSGNSTTSFALDAAGRRTVQTTTGQGPFPTGSVPKSEVTRHYGDDTDNPTWITHGSTTTRFMPGIGGELGISTTATGGSPTAELAIASPHDDTATTIPLPATGPITGITAWSDYTEYGTPRDPAATAVSSGPLGYGWLGTKERATAGETFGLTLMGVRYYNPLTGRFTSLDPVFGGNDNAYGYPEDPINSEDISGQVRLCSSRNSCTIGRGVLSRVARNARWNSVPQLVHNVSGQRIPMPQKTTWRSNYRYDVYQVRTASGATYKYGIGKSNNGRPKVGVRACNRQFGGGCTYRIIKRTTGYYNARVYEYNRITRYANRVGKCPPGQRYSCK